MTAAISQFGKRSSDRRPKPALSRSGQYWVPRLLAQGIRMADRLVRTRDGVRLHVSLLGSGTNTLIVPGTGNEADFEGHFSDCHVALFDIRNRGRSDSVPASGAVGLPVEVDDIDDVRKAVGFERCSLFAWSYPALVAGLYAARYPERVERLILACPPPAYAANGPGFFTARGRRPEDTSAVAPCLTADDARARRRELARSLMANPAGVDRLRSDPGLMPNEWPDHAANALIRVRATFPVDFDLRSELRTIAAPTLILHGAQDGIPLASSEELSRLIPNAHLVVLPDVGHLPHVEAPNQFSRSIKDFLSE